MNFIDVNQNLSLKKLDKHNNKDIWLAETLDNDQKVFGSEGFLYSIKNILIQPYYLNKKGPYGIPYGIYYDHKNPIGYLEVSDIFTENQTVFLDYALIKEQRGKGYMCNTLIGTSNKIFEDKINKVKKIELMIDPDNIDSKKTASNAGFTYEEHDENGFEIYQLTKNKRGCREIK